MSEQELIEEDINEECLCPICFDKPESICLCKGCPIWIDPENLDIIDCSRAEPCFYHHNAKKFPLGEDVEK